MTYIADGVEPTSRSRVILYHGLAHARHAPSEPMLLIGWCETCGERTEQTAEPSGAGPTCRIVDPECTVCRRDPTVPAGEYE